MCGIAGIWEFSERRITNAQFTAFINALAHRGPDGQGEYKDREEALFLGHRRLSILDISEKGTQPMSFGNQRFWITFNGEIYNFLELRKELEKLGYEFISDSDTEVLLASYIEWGDECQFKLNGMWAFAIWDSLEKRLFLSRDRFGVKPLYIMRDEKRFVFASELKAFLYLPQFKIEFNEQNIANVLVDGNFLESTEGSWIHGVQQLKRGHSLTYRKGDGIFIRQWWNTLDHLPSVPRKWEEQVEQFRILFIDACRIRSRSDVPTATALSGGLDSSSILATIAHLRKSKEEERVSKEWRYVFSALFPETSQDEGAFIEQMVRHTKTTSFYSKIYSETLVENLNQALYDFENIFDLPIGPWILYRGFRQQKVVISIDGHGADELLGGYQHHVEARIQELLFPKMEFSQACEMKQVLKNMYPPGSPFKNASYKSLIRKSAQELLYQVSPTMHRMLKKSFGTPQKKVEWLQIAPQKREYEKENPQLKPWSLLNRTLYIDFHERTLPTILRNFDRCSMAHGVEIRAPFMDWRLVTYAFALPESAKIGGGFTKRILREAMKGLLPESIRTRTFKVGFASPVNEWLKKDLRTFMLDHICSNSFQMCPFWKGPEILQFAERAYKKEDISGIRMVWEFVQANQLMQSFKASSCE